MTDNNDFSGVALYRLRRAGDDERPGMIPAWIEGAPKPEELATYARYGYSPECVYWASPARPNIAIATDCAGGLLTLTIALREGSVDTVLHQEQIDIQKEAIAAVGAALAEVGGVRDTLVVASNNPSAHGREQGLIGIMKAQADRLDRLIIEACGNPPAPRAAPLQWEARNAAEGIITDLGMRLFTDQDKPLLEELASRIRELVARPGAGKVPESWWKQAIKNQHNAQDETRDLTDRLAQIAQILGVTATGDEIETQIRSLRSNARSSVDLAFDLGFEWRQMLQGHVLDGRDVGRTLTSDVFAGLGVNPSVIDAFSTREQAIVTAKAEIKRAIRTAPAPDGDASAQPAPSDIEEHVAAAGYNAWCDEPDEWPTANGMERKRWRRIAKAVMEVTGQQLPGG